MEAVAFTILSLITIWAAIMIVVAKKVVHSVFWLLVTFFSTACIFLLMEAEFLAVVQILVNAGAVVISFLFIIILTNLHEEPKHERYHKQGRIASVTVILLFLFLGLFLIPRGDYLHQTGEAIALQTAKWGGNSELIAKFIFTEHILPFEIIALVLLVAIIGVVALGKKLPSEKVE